MEADASPWPPLEVEMRVSLAASVLALAALGLTPEPAAGQSGSVTPYALQKPSSFARGCYGPCACPVIQSALRGTFDLRSAPPDPLYSRYAVERVSWVADEPTPHSIVGSGTYEVGGEVAVQHRMVLDLSIDGGPVRRYDSGLVSGGGDFPHIAIAVRLHDGSACTDTVLTIDASPGVTGVDPRDLTVPRASPNPFVRRVEVRFRLAAPGPVEASVHDLGGRLVRRLVQGEWWQPGIHSFAWDGEDESGRRVAAGRYRIRLEAGGRVAETQVVRLR